MLALKACYFTDKFTVIKRFLTTFGVKLVDKTEQIAYYNSERALHAEVIARLLRTMGGLFIKENYL